MNYDLMYKKMDRFFKSNSADKLILMLDNAKKERLLNSKNITMDNNIIDKRTKGEWKVDSIASPGTVICDNKRLAECLMYNKTVEEAEANAAFIVKACNEYDKLKEQIGLTEIDKELLEALKEMCEVQGNGMGREMNAYNNAKEAIKKHSPIN